MAFSSNKWLFAALLLFQTAMAVHAQQKDSFEVKSLRIHDNARISDARLKRVMQTRQTSFFQRGYFRPDVFHRDLRNVVAYYREYGFLDAAITDTLVTIDSSRGFARIAFRVKEGLRTHISGVKFRGNSIYGDSLLAAQTQLKPGDPLIGPKVRMAGMKILDLYGAEGYLDAEVKPNWEISAPNRAAVVVFTIAENAHFIVGNIVIAGLAKTRADIVRRELTFSSGQPMRVPAFLSSQRNLYNTGLFRSVFIEPLRGQTVAGRTDVLVEVRERKSIELSLQGGYGTIERIRGGFSLVNINIAGTGRRTGLQAQASEIGYGAALSFAQSWTLGLPLHVDLRGYYEFREEIGFNFGRLGWQAQVGREFGLRSKALIGYRFENTTISNVQLATPPRQENARIRSIVLSANKDTRDDLFNASRGSYADIEQDLAGLFGSGSTSFSRTQISGKTFFPHGDAVYASAMQVGWIAVFRGDSLPLSERFYTGGPNSLRGFRYRSLGAPDSNNIPAGGRLKAILSFEIRQRLYRMIGGVVFVDVGNVWARAGDFSPGDIRYDVGLGPRVSTPLGVLRFDVAFNPSRKAGEDARLYVIAIGQAF